jgi:two-component system, OmpR family, response regulator
MQNRPSKKILVVDDNHSIRNSVALFLREGGYEVEEAIDGIQGLEKGLTIAPDLILLDVVMPVIDGFKLCQLLREKGVKVPIMMLTEKSTIEDKFEGFSGGADDYLAKPFNPRELVARIRAVLRRGWEAPEPATDKLFLFLGFTADPATRRLTDPAGEEVALTAGEFELLRVFLERPGRVLSRDQLLDLTQGRESDPFGRSIDVLVSRLRRKLGDTGSFQIFKTVRNGGYQLAARVETSD